MSKAAINPAPEARALRNIGRIKTLRLAIDKAEGRGNSKKKASLQEELNRRLEEVRVLQEAIAEVDGLNS